MEEFTDYQKKLLETLSEYLHMSVDNFRVVWFTKTLQNAKALVIVDNYRSEYYELTYNGDKHETYIDIYLKTINVSIEDQPLPTEEKES